MVDYTFYLNRGGKIPQQDWDHYAAQAQARLDRYKRIYTVTEPGPNAEALAVCALADVLHAQDQALQQPVSASIGSVSTSYGQKLDTSEKALAGRLYQTACLYLDIHRGCCV